MITFIKQNKLLVIVALIFVFGFAYYMFSSSSNSASPSLLTEDQASSAASQQLLVVLASLHTIRLDDGVFKDPIFLSLTDFGVAIAPENVGRRNPFAPFSGTSTSQTNIDVPPISQTIPVKPPTPRVRVFPPQ